MLTKTALDGYKEYTAKKIAYAMYKANGTWYKADIESVKTLSDGRLAIDFVIDHTTGPARVEAVKLYDTDSRPWLEKTENIKKSGTQEGILYRFTFAIREE